MWQSPRSDVDTEENVENSTGSVAYSFFSFLGSVSRGICLKDRGLAGILSSSVALPASFSKPLSSEGSRSRE